MNIEPDAEAENDSGGGGDDLPEKSPARRVRPIPPAYKHISINGCKTPGCENFGVAPREGAIVKGRGAREKGDGYVLTGLGTTDMRCLCCKKFSRLKSNKAIHEELERQRAYLSVVSPIRCSDERCPNHSPVGEIANNFRKYGKTRHGSDRWQCRLCKKTFSVGKPSLYHQKPHTNIRAFELLVNKVPISRMVEILGISASSVYGKIDFLYEQCKSFAASRENQFPELKLDRLYLCTDRQDYMVNWGDRKQKKTIQLTAVATADLSSGYVFGLTPNFDPRISPDELEKLVAAAGDGAQPVYALRECARLWTARDYASSVSRTGNGKTTARDDLEDGEMLDGGQQLPTTGAQVHAEYLMHGHFWLLKHLLPNIGKLRFFLDGDAALLTACLGAFAGDIINRRADVAVLMIEKELTTGARQAKFAAAKRQFAADQKRFPGLSLSKTKTAILAEKIAQIRGATPSDPRPLQTTWVDYPLPDLAEPEKKIRFVTDLGDYDDEHAANLLMKATLWPIDTVFNRIRRRLALCERAIGSRRRVSGKWHIYAPYDPAMIEKMLTIYRVWHNFVWVSPKSKQTAAERIGLAKGKVRIEDIVYFDARSVIKQPKWDTQ